MRKRHFLLVMFFVVMAFVAFFVARQIQQQMLLMNNAYMEAGMKLGDLKWLCMYGKVSDKELKQLQDATAGGVDIRELNELLDSMLDGKAEECLQEQLENSNLFP